MLTRSVVLIGLMGSGKTTAGRRLAKQIGCVFVDTDDVVCELAGAAVREIFERSGEAKFREYESIALAQILQDKTPRIIAAAGGVVLAEKNRDVIEASGAHVVWLQAETTALVERAALGAHRPLLDGDPHATMELISIAREKLYAGLADTRIDTNNQSVKSVAEVLFAGLVANGVVIDSSAAALYNSRTHTGSN
jgi:shikimate kinase